MRGTDGGGFGTRLAVRLAAFLVAAYRVLLPLYPGGFRRDYGEEMAGLFSDQVREVGDTEGAVGLVKLGCRTLLDLLASALDERGRALYGEASGLVARKLYRPSPWADAWKLPVALGSVFVFLAVLSAVREKDPVGVTPGLLFGASMVCLGFGEGLSLRRRHLAAALRLCGAAAAGSGLTALAVLEFSRGGTWGLVGLLLAMVVVVFAMVSVLSDRTRPGGRIESFLAWVGGRDVSEKAEG